MFKVLKYVFYVLAIIVIAASVYIATLPSKFEHTYSIMFNKAPKQMIKHKLLRFDQWKDWAIKDSTQFKVVGNSDPLQSSLQSSLVNKQGFKLENEQISDSLIIQKLYTANERTIQTLTWHLGNYRTVDGLNLELKEELSFSDKLHELLKWENGKRSWLLNLENRLTFLQQQVTKKASDYTVGEVKRTSFGPYHYIYMTGSGNINHLNEQTQQHIIELEQFLAEQRLRAMDKPFTIYNSELANGDVIFSTALPISDSIQIPANNPIRYDFKASAEAYRVIVKGNPQDMGVLWKKFEQTKELTLSPMSTNKYLRYTTPTNGDSFLDKQQQLLWEIQTKKKEVVLDTLENVTTIAKDSLYKPL